MAVTSVKARQSSFHDRLKRIEGHGANTFGQVYMGEGGSVTGSKARKAKSIVDRSKPKGPGLLRRLVGFLVTLSLGGAAVLAARIAMFRLSGMPDTSVDPMTFLGREAGFAFVIGLLLAIAFGVMRKGRLFPLLLGVAAGLGLGHNAVHLAPEFWEVATSPQYTASVQNSTALRTFILMDQTYPF